MVCIEINEFGGYTQEEFECFLKEQGTDEFLLVLKKGAALTPTEGNAKAWEYAVAAYTGERIAVISSSFSHSELWCEDGGEFSFCFRNNDLPALAIFLFELSAVFGNMAEADPFLFTGAVADLIQKSEYSPIACTGLMDSFLNYYDPEME